jgi:hypothetical protein
MTWLHLSPFFPCSSTPDGWKVYHPYNLSGST